MSRILVSALIALGLAACADMGPPLPPPPVHANGQALWRIVHDQCVPDQRARSNPSPCSLVSISGGEVGGFAILKDRIGVAQQLLIPTSKITGIEDPAILQPEAVNYFARAWEQRGFVEDRLGRRLAPTQLSITVNSMYGRSQDQLHLHIDCLARTVADTLRSVSVPTSGSWSERAIRLKGHNYRVRWLNADKLATISPFDLLAREIPGARKTMGAWTLALVGAVGPNGYPGFLILADRTDPATSDRGSAEELQDHDCR